jgi:glycosyltransferase involved in cell wall biosynthesis
MKKKYLIVSANIEATDENSFFEPSRLAPKTNLEFEHLNYSISKQLFLNTTSISYLKSISPDCIIISRIVLDISQKCIDYCRAHAVPCIFHLDDDLFNVPKSVGEKNYNHYSSSKFRNSLDLIVKQVDKVLVSTQALCDRLNANGINNTVVMPFCKSYTLREPHDMNMYRPYPVIGYMGTASHLADLERIVPSIKTLLRRYSSLYFETLGVDIPSSLQDEFPNQVKQHQKFNSYAEFLRSMKELGWWAGLAPLEHSSFNFCKANTKWVEYTECGIPSIVESFGPYEILPRRNQAIGAMSLDDWDNGMDLLLRNPRVREEVLTNSVKHLKLYANPQDLIAFYESLLDDLVSEMKGKQ